MKKVRILYSALVLASYLSMIVAVTSCHKNEKNELAHDHEHEHEHGHDDHEHAEHEGHEGHNHGSSLEIILEPEIAERMGVKTEVVSHADFSDAVKTTGRIETTPSGIGTITSPTAGIFSFAGNFSVGTKVNKGSLIGTVNASDMSGGDANAMALANLNNAKRELDRLKGLYEKQLVTADKYNAALAQYELAKAAYSPKASTGKVTATTSGTITEVLIGEGAYVDAGTPIAYLADGSLVTLTADLPDKYADMVPFIKDARIVYPATGSTMDVSEFKNLKIQTTNTVSNTPGYIPVIFSFDNDSRVRPGSVVEVYLLGNARHDVVTVPLSAVTEQQGNYFVFVKVDDEGYLKSPVTLGYNDGKRVEILSGIEDGDEIVVEGVTAVRLAETSGAVPEGHTHSH